MTAYRPQAKPFDPDEYSVGIDAVDYGRLRWVRIKANSGDIASFPSPSIVAEQL
jgi:hypothetical protein